MNINGQSGPRDWSPPEYGERIPGYVPTPVPVRPVLPARGYGSGGRVRGPHPGGTFRRGVLSSLLVIPLGIVAWLLLWQFGVVSAAVGWMVGALAVLLFRWGSGGVISRRGIGALVLVVSLTVLLALGSAVFYDDARAYVAAPGSVLHIARTALPDPAFWSWEVAGFALAAIGLIPPLAMARRARPSGGARAASIALSIVSIVVVGAIAITLRPVGAGSADLTRLERSGLIVGDCITQPADPAAPIEAADLPRVDCAEPHWGEVVFVGSTPGRDGLTAYPGDDWLTQDADARCARAFADYVGLPPTQSILGRQFFVPTAEGWVQGDRGEVCAVFDPTLPSFAGSLEQVAR